MWGRKRINSRNAMEYQAPYVFADLSVIVDFGDNS